MAGLGRAFLWPMAVRGLSVCYLTLSCLGPRDVVCLCSPVLLVSLRLPLFIKDEEEGFRVCCLELCEVCRDLCWKRFGFSLGPKGEIAEVVATLTFSLFEDEGLSYGAVG